MSTFGVDLLFSTLNNLNLLCQPLGPSLGMAVDSEVCQVEHECEAFPHVVWSAC